MADQSKQPAESKRHMVQPRDGARERYGQGNRSTHEVTIVAQQQQQGQQSPPSTEKK